MSVERCNVCEKHVVDDDCCYCTECTAPVCDNCVRVREDDPDCKDYCLPCYLILGHGEMWEVEYLTTQGDLMKMQFDTPVNTCSFLIPKYAKNSGGFLFHKVANYHKVREEALHVN